MSHITNNDAYDVIRCLLSETVTYETKRHRLRNTPDTFSIHYDYEDWPVEVYADLFLDYHTIQDQLPQNIDWDDDEGFVHSASLVDWHFVDQSSDIIHLTYRTGAKA